MRLEGECGNKLKVIIKAQKWSLLKRPLYPLTSHLFSFIVFLKEKIIINNIELKQLSMDMGKPEYDMLQGISAVENGFTNPAYDLSYDEYKEWLRITDNNSRGIDLPEGWIPYTTYVLYVDGIPVGYGRVRHSSSEYLETVVGAGNLGYGIAKEYRGKGYGSILFKELLKKCKEIGYKEIKLFPMKSNEPTVKIMLKNGGQIIGDFKNQKHIIRIPLEIVFHS